MGLKEDWLNFDTLLQHIYFEALIIDKITKKHHKTSVAYSCRGSDWPCGGLHGLKTLGPQNVSKNLKLSMLRYTTWLQNR